MIFPDFRWNPNPTASSSSYVGHSVVLKYLQDYADHYQLLPYIRFGHNLINVTRDHKLNCWKIKVCKLWITNDDDKMNNNGTTTTETSNIKQYCFDVLILCPGRYAYPYWPENLTQLGISQFAGSVIHSHDYRSNDCYINKKVAIIGGGPSGIDICLEIAQVASNVIILVRSSKVIYKGLPSNVQQINGEIVEFLNNSGNRTIKVRSCDVRYESDDPIFKIFEIDFIIFATGYRFNLSYLDKKTVGIKVQPNETLQGLYRHYINIQYPTMIILSVLQRVLPFALFQQQILYFMKCLLGQVYLPSQKEMLQHSELDFQKRKTLGFRDQDRHLANFDLLEEYFKQIADDGKLEPIPDVMMKLYRHLINVRCENIVTYKDRQYRIIDNGTSFEEIIT